MFTPRCSQCGGACETAHYDPVPLRCPRGHRFDGTWPTHGEKRTVELSWRSLMRGDWKAAWLARAAGGPLVVDACPKCARAVTLDASTELSYGCTHCGGRSAIEAGRGVLDILPEATMKRPMWALFHSEVSIAPFLHRGTSDALSCPSCGAPTERVDGRGECAACETTLVALTSCGQRFIPGIRLTGTHQGTRIDGWMPVADGLDYFERYRKYVRRSPVATVGVPLSLLMVVLCLPIPLLVFVIGGVAADLLFQLAQWTGSAFLAGAATALIAGSVSAWGVMVVVIGLCGLFLVTLPFLFNAMIRRRLGMNRPPDVRPIPSLG